MKVDFLVTTGNPIEETVVRPSGAIGVVRPEYLTHREVIAALKQFTKKLERMSPNGRRAAIGWLIDFYLGDLTVIGHVESFTE